MFSIVLSRPWFVTHLQPSVVCNASAINFRASRDFPAVFCYANVNRIQQYTIQTPQGAAWPPRTDVLGVFVLFKRWKNLNEKLISSCGLSL